VTERGWVYFIRCADDVKIGWSKNVAKRMRAIQTTASAPLELLGTFRGTRDDERELHRRFAALHKHGEWFSASDDLLSAVGFFCGTGLQAEARMGAKIKLWPTVIYEAIHALRMLGPEGREDAGGFFADVEEALWGAYNSAYDAREQVKEQERERTSLWGPYADKPLRMPRKPSVDEVWADFDRRQAEKEADKAAELAARPLYLDLRAIFAEEFASDEAEQVAA
jgi:hypothetical protein